MPTATWAFAGVEKKAAGTRIAPSSRKYLKKRITYLLAKALCIT
jgi:hypothetical protein